MSVVTTYNSVTLTIDPTKNEPFLPWWGLISYDILIVAHLYLPSDPTYSTKNYPRKIWMRKKVQRIILKGIRLDRSMVRSLQVRSLHTEVRSLHSEVSSLHQISYFAPYISYFAPYISYFAPCFKMYLICMNARLIGNIEEWKMAKVLTRL